MEFAGGNFYPASIKWRTINQALKGSNALPPESLTTGVNASKARSWVRIVHPDYREVPAPLVGECKCRLSQRVVGAENRRGALRKSVPTGEKCPPKSTSGSRGLSIQTPKVRVARRWTLLTSELGV